MKIKCINTSLVFEKYVEPSVIVPVLVAGQWLSSGVLATETVSNRSRCSAAAMVEIEPNVQFTVEWSNGINNVAMSVWKYDGSALTWVANISNGVPLIMNTQSYPLLQNVDKLAFTTEPIYNSTTELTASDLEELNLTITQ